MSLYALDESSNGLHLDSYVVKAVHRLGFIPVVRVAILAWMNQPRIPDSMSDRLRADMGLPPAERLFPKVVEDYPILLAMVRP